MNCWDRKFEFSQQLSSFGYPNTNETVNFIEISGITDATGKFKRNLNTQDTQRKVNFGSEFNNRLPWFFAKNSKLMF